MGWPTLISHMTKYDHRLSFYHSDATGFEATGFAQAGDADPTEDVRMAHSGITSDVNGTASPDTHSGGAVQHRQFHASLALLEQHW
eukprot:3195553-Rhodomonas_salina.2